MQEFIRTKNFNKNSDVTKTRKTEIFFVDMRELKKKRGILRPISAKLFCGKAKL